MVPVFAIWFVQAKRRRTSRGEGVSFRGILVLAVRGYAARRNVNIMPAPVGDRVIHSPATKIPRFCPPSFDFLRSPSCNGGARVLCTCHAGLTSRYVHREIKEKLETTNVSSGEPNASVVSGEPMF